MAVKHHFALLGRSGQHQHMDAVLVKGAAGGGTHGVVKHRAALRQLRLMKIILRHGNAEHGFIKPPKLLGNIRSERQPASKCPADNLLGEIVIGRPQPTHGDDHIRPFPGDVQRRFQPRGVVPHHGVPKHVDAQSGQASRDHLRIGIRNAAQK